MKTAVCMVVKNEEYHIAMALNSVQHADAIYVLDTGSTDLTLDIVRGFGLIYHGEFKMERRDFGGDPMRFGSTYREKDARNLTVIRSRTTFTVRSKPYLAVPAFLGRWFTTISPTLAPAQPARAGMNLCISPYSLVSSSTSRR